MAVYLFGECSDLIEQNKVSFSLDSTLRAVLKFIPEIDDRKCLIFALNSITKILAKNNVSDDL